MKLGAEDKKKAIIAGVAGVVAIGALAFTYSSIFGGATPPPPSAPIIVDNTHPTAATPGVPAKVTTAPPGYAVAGAAQLVGSTSGQLDPTLHEEAMLNTESLIYSGSGRNIFSGISEAPPPKAVIIPVAVAGPRGPIIPSPPPIPCPPNCPPPPPPPPINLKFFGTSTSASGDKKAFLLGGDDVFLAAQGDIVQRKYRVVSISNSTILIEDIPNTNKQTLPLIPN